MMKECRHNFIDFKLVYVISKKKKKKKLVYEIKILFWIMI